MTTTIEISIPVDLLDETIDALEHIGCQFWACEGPTLEPISMVTCVGCATLAKLRVAAGRDPLGDDQ